jgi:hypothetical protein
MHHLSRKRKKAPHTREHRFITHEQALLRQERELVSLHPVFEQRVISLVAHLNNKGWQAFVFQGKTRTPEQAAKNVKKKTGIKMSWHRPDVIGSFADQVVQLYAADIVDERWGWEGPARHLNHPFWNDLGAFAKAEGLEWGGDFKDKMGKGKPDVAHVQMRIIDSPPSGSVTV